MHRVSLQQEAYAVDIRNMQVRRKLEPIFEEVTGVSCKELRDGKKKMCGEEKDWKALSLAFAKRVREEGYIILWDPNM